MIADGASLSEVLKQLCAAIDEHTLAISLVMLWTGGAINSCRSRSSPPAGSDCRFYTWQSAPTWLLRHGGVYRKAGSSFPIFRKTRLAVMIGAWLPDGWFWITDSVRLGPNL